MMHDDICHAQRRYCAPDCRKVEHEFDIPGELKRFSSAGLADIEGEQEAACLPSVSYKYEFQI